MIGEGSHRAAHAGSHRRVMRSDSATPGHAQHMGGSATWMTTGTVMSEVSMPHGMPLRRSSNKRVRRRREEMDEGRAVLFGIVHIQRSEEE